mmetsp:Transcript_11459/g.24313  ORF Transcript_11459/g.24313 Transcript_11459/m.24313 type:complete len:85 (-) Transcript_11459:104-358(-)
MNSDRFGSISIPAAPPTQQFGIFNTKEQKQDPYTKLEIRGKGRLEYSSTTTAPALRLEINTTYSSSSILELSFRSLEKRSSTHP